MFVALRDLRFARGRFLLIGSVVALITILVGFLSGLTGGLATQNISAVLSIPGDRIVFSAPTSGDAVSFADSVVTEEQASAADWVLLLANTVSRSAAVSPVNQKKVSVRPSASKESEALKTKVFGPTPRREVQDATGFWFWLRR